MEEKELLTNLELELRRGTLVLSVLSQLAQPRYGYSLVQGLESKRVSIDPNTSEVYVADAIDYQQKGIVYRYSPEGELLDEFRAGIIPGAFCWY